MSASSGGRAAPMARLLPIAALACGAFALGGCERGHSARWYMAHGEAMSAKVKECQADPQRAAADKDCANAIEAFVAWARATGNAAPADGASAPESKPEPKPDAPKPADAAGAR